MNGRVARIAKAAGFVFLLLLGVLWACPWDRLVESALVEASRRAENAGVLLSYGQIRMSSNLPPRVEILDLSAESFLGALKVQKTTLGIRPLATLFSMAPSLEVGGSVATLSLAGTAPMQIGTIQAEVNLDHEILRLDRIRLDGDLTLSGQGSWSTAENRFTAADLLLKAPAALNPSLQVLTLSQGLKPAGGGQWRLRIP